jgi:hypothetical protein
MLTKKDKLEIGKIMALGLVRFERNLNKKLDQKLDDQGIELDKRLDQKLDKQGINLEKKLSLSLDERLDKVLDEKFKKWTDILMKDLMEFMNIHSERIDKQEKEIDADKGVIEDHERRIEKLEEKVFVQS